MVSAILEVAGYKTALVNSIRIKIGDDSKPNTMRMSMPGRFFLESFLSEAVRKGCTAAVMEMTSEGARQHRHRGISLDALIFTNLAPEHIESHGSFEAYANAKFSLGVALANSPKRQRIMVANKDDPQSSRFLALPVEHVVGFSLSTQKPYEASANGGYFTFEGTRIHVALPGEFSLKNALAAASLAKALNISTEHIERGIASVTHIPGRAEEISEGQSFRVIIDYAHTPDSLEAIYKAYGDARKIAVLGSMGGSRDSWNRPEKGRLADTYCQEVFLTNEDPCDDDPMKIIGEIAQGVKGKTPHIILDRREAIRASFAVARAGDVVLITGKGTDPWIYGARGQKIPWSDAEVAREELRALMNTERV
jgi:UDP-N-acetylmuramoyl-L-alanyl-D-glutamate--2,6-diaminopimelate ligase